MINKKHLKFFLSIIGITGCINLSAQLINYKDLDTIPELNLQQALKKDPLTVYKLNLKKLKLVELPQEIGQFLNLQTLNVNKNKLSRFPEVIFNFKYLQKLNVSGNKIKTIPPEIGLLIHLKEFAANETEISTLPKEISQLKELEYLDVWGTNISWLPEEIVQLSTTLKKLDMRVILMSDEEHKKIQELLPQTMVYFSKSCSCGF